MHVQTLQLLHRRSGAAASPCTSGGVVATASTTMTNLALCTRAVLAERCIMRSLRRRKGLRNRPLRGLEPGEHQTDAAKQLGCSTRTLYNHTHKEVNWRWPKRQHIQADTKRTRKSRAAFAGIALTQSGRLKKKLRDATWLDHKIAHEFGLNRSYERQCRR